MLQKGIGVGWDSARLDTRRLDLVLKKWQGTDLRRADGALKSNQDIRLTNLAKGRYVDRDKYEGKVRDAENAILAPLEHTILLKEE